jgi:hypothetical protein
MSVTDTFAVFCKEGNADHGLVRESFLEICKQYSLIGNSFTVADAVLLFERIVPQKHLRMNLHHFSEALDQISTRRELPCSVLQAFVAARQGDLHQARFVKICEESGLIDSSFGVVDVILIFAELIPKGQKMNIERFCQSFDKISKKKSMSPERVQMAVTSSLRRLPLLGREQARDRIRRASDGDVFAVNAAHVVTRRPSDPMPIRSPAAANMRTNRMLRRSSDAASGSCTSGRFLHCPSSPCTASTASLSLSDSVSLSLPPSPSESSSSSGASDLRQRGPSDASVAGGHTSRLVDTQEIHWYSSNTSDQLLDQVEEVKVSMATSDSIMDNDENSEDISDGLNGGIIDVGTIWISGSQESKTVANFR